MSYGAIADALAERSGRNSARQVGTIMARHGGGVPWHRVVNAQGTISPRAHSDSVRRQELLLQAEGVRFDEQGRLSLRKYQWRPRR